MYLKQVSYYKFKASRYSAQLVRCRSHGLIATVDSPLTPNGGQRACVRLTLRVIYKKSSFGSGSAMCFTL